MCVFASRLVRTWMNYGMRNCTVHIAALFLDLPAVSIIHGAGEKKNFVKKSGVNNPACMINVVKKLCWKDKWCQCLCVFLWREVEEGGGGTCVALFHIPATEMHLHKVLMRFEGRGGVVN